MARASVKRHAQAVFSIALERDELDRWLSDLRRIAQAMAEELQPGAVPAARQTASADPSRDGSRS